MGRTKRIRQYRKRADVNEMEQKILSGDSYLSTLFKYMIDLGWKNETDLTVRNFTPSGRGVISKTNYFAEGDVIIRLPLKSLITILTLENDMGFKTQFKTNNFHQEQSISFQSLMSIYLLYHIHLKEKSPIHAYIKSLPMQFSTPFFCCLSELQCLPDLILEKVVIQNRKIREEFLNLKAAFEVERCRCCDQTFFTDIYTLNKFRWAYFVVNTRCVYINSSYIKPVKSFFKNLLKTDTNLAIAPFCDLFNHSDEIQTTAELQLNGTNEYEYVLTIKKTSNTITPRGQIFINYGHMNNFKLFTEYGFILNNNKHDYFEFSLHDIQNFIKFNKNVGIGNIHNAKLKFIRDHNLDGQMFVQIGEGISHNLHVVLHVIFKENSIFPNILSQAAFGSPNHLQNVDKETRLLIAYKIAEYLHFINNLKKLSELSESGKMSIDYLQQCITYLDILLNI